MYIDGPNLTQLVYAEGALRTSAVLTLAAGLSEALVSIHRVGLVHRDLKPSNVIVNDAGPHIIDFGIAFTPATARLTTQQGGGHAVLHRSGDHPGREPEHRWATSSRWARPWRSPRAAGIWSPTGPRTPR